MAKGRKRRTNGALHNEDAERGAEEGRTYHIEDGEDEGPSQLLNSAARAEVIREAHETIGEYEKQIKGLKAEIKAVVETRIVAGLGMKKGDFATARKLVEMDQGERDTLQDTIRETFSALGVGMQLNWLDAAEAEGADA